MNLQAVNVNQLSAKMKSKKELYNFLLQDCQAYLPPMDATNVYFLKQIMRGVKEYIRRDKILVAAVPQIEGLTVEAMLELAKTSAAALRHLPDERDWDGLNRKWVADILYTVERAKLEKVIKDAVKARKDRLEEKNNLLVEMRPEFAQAFQNCMNFSLENGRASMLMKGSSKRKRTKAELEEVKQEEEALRGDTQAYLMDVKRLKQEHAEMLAFLQNEQNQPQVQQQMGNQPGNGGQMMQFNI